MRHDEVTLSHFLRRSGDVLDVLDGGDVTLSRRDGVDLVLTTTTRTTVRSDALGLLGDVVLAALSVDGGVLARVLADAAPWTSCLTSEERARMLREVARAAATGAELDTTGPLERALERWRRTARSRAVQRPRPTYETRPVSIPDDVDDPSIEKASGVIELPLRVRWSHPLRPYDLGDVRQLRRVYEQVLREGTDDDVRRFIDVDALVEHWDALVLPPAVRRAWAGWLRARRGLDLPC